MIGIYSITNLVDGKRYIGQSVNIKTRLGYHRSLLKSGKHKNAHLQRAFLKYGAGCFRFDVVCECLECELDDQEKYWIGYHKTIDMNYGYNLNTGGSLFRRFTQDVIERLRIARRNRKSEQRSNNNIGRLNSGETERVYKELKKMSKKVVKRDLWQFTPEEIAELDYVKRMGVTAERIARAAGRNFGKE